LSTLSPAQAIKALINDIQQLIDDGKLKRLGGLMLTYELKAAEKAIESKRDWFAIKMLRVFKMSVTHYVRIRILDSVEGQPLINKANAIIDQLAN
jgi:hypothetical protein